MSAEMKAQIKDQDKDKIPRAGDRVLWIRFGAFGDALEAAAGAYNFKRRFPGTHLTFLSHPEYSEALRVQPYIDGVISGHKKPLSRWRETVRSVRAGRYQWLVNTHRGGKSSLLALFSGAAHRIGTCSIFCFKYNYHMSVDHWARLCGMDVHDRSRPSVFATEEDREAARRLLAPLPERRLFAVIGASSVRKMWTDGGWTEFLRPLLNDGWGVVLNGHGPLEEALGKKIERALASENVLNLVGALDFRKMSGVALACTMAIGNDTGPLHLAALGGVPTVGLLNRPARDSALALLDVPWFRELRAEDYVRAGRRDFPLKKLPAAPVSEKFAFFAEEFLPTAFKWRGDFPGRAKQNNT